MNKLLTLLLLVLSTTVVAKLPSDQWLLDDTPLQITVQGLADKAAQAAAEPRKPGTAARFAVKAELPRDLLAGKWEETPDGRLFKRIRIQSPGAVNLNLALSPFFLPHGAELHFLDEQKTTVWGPWTDQNNPRGDTFWTPVVPGETAWLEITVPKAMQPFVKLGLKSVQHGFIDPADALLKSGSCNVDVACPEGDNWRDEIKAASMFTLGGEDTCSGTLINNAREDKKLYFLTANHCGLDSSNAGSTVFYWEYESPTCRAVDTAANGTPINRSQYTVATTMGATFRASNPLSDFALLELDEDPAPLAEVYWAGWDRRDVQNGGPVTVIHHPRLDEKRISFEYDDVLAGPAYSNYTQGADDGFWRVTDWDVGTTEGGSSGSGLWNASHHLIGQLLGGGAACGNDESDWFGRLAVSWDRGTTASTRLKDWLDPDNTGVDTVDGKAECDQPQVSIQSSANPAVPGQSVIFSASASGGAGGYSYAWDVNGDGKTDYNGPSMETIYSEAYSGNVTVTVTDSAQCSRRASLAQVVSAPSFSVSGLAPSEVCGDGDNVMEPGEQWNIPVTINNSSNQNAGDVIAVLTRSDALNAQAKAAGGPDSFGYTYRDSGELGCPYAGVDISSSGTALSLTASGSYPALDDGGALVNLENADFRLYGDTISQIVASSNGYLTTNLQASGGDFSQDCPLPALPSTDANGHRIAPMHDDLVVNNLYYQHFSSCPRPSDVDGGGGCHVFQWEGTSVYQGSNTTGNFRVQAFLYDGTDEIVYQYSNGVAVGASPTIGLQNANISSGLTYNSCGATDPVQDNTAVCFYAPGKTPAGGDAANLALQTPVLYFGDVAANAQASQQATVALLPNMACGAQFGIDVQGVAYTGGYDPDASYRIFGGQAGGDNQVCDFDANNSQCDLSTSSMTPANGLWNNSGRVGHGLDIFFINGDSVFMAWYTARADHSPIWYTATGPLRNNQVHATLYRLKWNSVSNSVSEQTAVGSVTLNLAEAGSGWFTWEVDGHRGTEPVQVYNDALQTPAVNYSGMWYNPNESGWGITFNNKGETNFSLIYFYDENGEPSWVLGTNQDDNGGQVDMLHAQATCPWCPVVPLDFQNAGSINFNFTSQTEGTVDTSVQATDRVYDVNWQRSNLPFYMISEPE